jgi:hypothetical protein
MANLDVGRRADAAGLRASRAWLLGKGLADEVDDVRFQSGEKPVRAPGLPKLVDRLERYARDVLALSERVDALLAGTERSWDLESIIEVEVEAAEEGADAVEQVARQIAQLALGVSMGLEPSDRAERLESAAIAVLTPPGGGSESADLVDDGIELFCRDKQDLRVELQGVFCRMLLDRDVSVRIGEVELTVGPDQTLHLSTSDGDTAWEPPVEVSVPARLTAKVLISEGMSYKQIRNAAVTVPL